MIPGYAKKYNIASPRLFTIIRGANTSRSYEQFYRIAKAWHKGVNLLLLLFLETPIPLDLVLSYFQSKRKFAASVHYLRDMLRFCSNENGFSVSLRIEVEFLSERMDRYRRPQANKFIILRIVYVKSNRLHVFARQSATFLHTKGHASFLATNNTVMTVRMYSNTTRLLVREKIDGESCPFPSLFHEFTK